MRQFLPLQCHADGTLLANGTFICRLHVEIIAFLVQIVPTWHGYNGGRRCEEVLAADGTVVVDGICQAFVFAIMRHANAHITVLLLVRLKPF
jgi:hypothetical protein